MNKKWLVICFALVLLMVGLVYREYKPNQPPVSDLIQIGEPISAQFNDKNFYLKVITAVSSTPTTGLVTGITVPHHLLASELIASAFDYASTTKPELILLISPDHFFLGQTDATVTTRDFNTPFGTIETKKDSVENLLKLNFVKQGDFFYREHGLGAELPFIKYYFPNSKIIAVTVKGSATKKELDELITVLKRILPKNSLVVQSTDFSHYLTAEVANQKDRKTITVLEQNQPDLLWTLNQPDNLDSIASQYVQMKLQKEFFGSKLNILAHKNSQAYTNDLLDSTTSYIVQGYAK